MGDRGTDEAFIVIYGLLPSREYELLLSVEGKQQSATLALSTTAEREEKPAISNVAMPIATSGDQSRSASASTSSSAPTTNRLRTHTPPMQDTDATPLDLSAEQIGAALNAATSVPASAAALSSSAIQASLRRARKDASRAESALRSEIEAIKRGLERMSDVDHRSKQKVLALQESIRQATLHAKDIDEEATLVEGERDDWEEKEREKDEELIKLKDTVEENLRLGEAKIKQDDEEIEVGEKELSKATKGLEEKSMMKDKLEKESIAEVEREIQRLQLEIENLLQPPAIQPQGYAHFYNMPAQGQTATSFVPPQVVNRGKGRGGASRGGNRSSSNPVTSGPHRRNHNRQRVQGQVAQSNASDEPLHDFHGSSSSSTHGSILNPNNPEFVPANSSPIVTKSTMLPHTEYSPSPNSRFAFSSTPLYGLDHDTERRNSLGHSSLSPRTNTLVAKPLASTPWITNSPAGVAGTSWSNSNLTSSPTLHHDIWGAPTAGGASSNSLHSPSSALHTKTSVPFGLNASLLRGGTTAQSSSFAAASSRNEDGSLSSYLNIPFDDEAVYIGSGSAPVSPSHPSNNFVSLAVHQPGE